MPSNADRAERWRKRRLDQKKRKEATNAKKRRRRREIEHEENLTLIEVSADKCSSGDEEETKEEVGVTSLPRRQVGDAALLEANAKGRGHNAVYSQGSERREVGLKSSYKSRARAS